MRPPTLGRFPVIAQILDMTNVFWEKAEQQDVFEGCWQSKNQHIWFFSHLSIQTAFKNLILFAKLTTFGPAVCMCGVDQFYFSKVSSEMKATLSIALFSFLFGFVFSPTLDSRLFGGDIAQARSETKIAQSRGEDRYRQFFDADSFRGVQEEISQTYRGIGVRISQNDSGEIEILEVFPRSPAENAQLKTTDIITSVNERSTVGMSLSEVVDEIRGVPGTSLTLELKSKDQSPVKKEILREQVIVRTVSPLLTLDDSIHYLRIREFGNWTDDEFAAELINLNEPYSLIVDLRGNTGGILDSAFDILDMLTPANVEVLYVKNQRSGRTDIRKTSQAASLDPKRVIILTDRLTASASEILAGNLRILNDAILVGDQTYGKGSVQSIFALDNGGGAKMTTAYFYLADYSKVDGNGLKPDYTVSTRGLGNRSISPEMLTTDDAVLKALELLSIN